MKNNHSDERPHPDSHHSYGVENGAVKELADLISESIRFQEAECVDPAEVYFLELKKRLVNDAHTFRDRFFRGYLSLMDVLKEDEESKGHP